MNDRDIANSTGGVGAAAYSSRGGGKRARVPARETGADFVARIDLVRAQQRFGAMLEEDARAEAMQHAGQRSVAMDAAQAARPHDIPAFPPQTSNEAPMTMIGRITYVDGRRGFGVVVPDDGGENVLIRLSGGGVTGIANLCVGVRLRCAVQRGARYLEVVTADLADGEQPAPACDDPAMRGGVDPKVWERATLKWLNRVRGFGFMSLGEGRPVLFVEMATLRRCGFEDVHIGQRLQVRAEWRRLRVIVIEARPDDAVVD